MSWGITITGEASKVIDRINDPTCKTYGDPSQFNAAKAFIVGEVEALKATPLRAGIEPAPIYVEVQAGGHHDSDGNRNVNIRVQRVFLTGCKQPVRVPRRWSCRRVV